MNILRRVMRRARIALEDPVADGVLQPEMAARIQPNSLLFYFGNIHSQRGQDGILAEIFRRLSIQKGFFVEFGAWDGVYLSNSRFLYEKGWSGAFIEGDPRKFSKLSARYRGDASVRCINSMVGAPRFGVKGARLKDLLQDAFIRADDVTFVSIDVDGPDLEIFEDMGFSPAVVLLEGGSNFSPRLTTRVPGEIAWNNMQQPLAVIFEAGRKRGYEPVCFFQDTYLVRRDQIAPFRPIASDVVDLYTDGFCFMTEGHRRALLELRERSGIIQSIEMRETGRFARDPLVN